MRRLLQQEQFQSELKKASAMPHTFLHLQPIIVTVLYGELKAFSHERVRSATNSTSEANRIR